MLKPSNNVCVCETVSPATSKDDFLNLFIGHFIKWISLPLTDSSAPCYGQRSYHHLVSENRTTTYSPLFFCVAESWPQVTRSRGASAYTPPHTPTSNGESRVESRVGYKRSLTYACALAISRATLSTPRNGVPRRVQCSHAKRASAAVWDDRQSSNPYNFGPLVSPFHAGHLETQTC